MTEAQLFEKYKCDTIVAAIIANLKLDASRWRPHPDAPECKEAIQYWALDKETQSEVQTKSEAKSATMDFALDKSGAAAIMPLIAQALSQQSSSSFSAPAASLAPVAPVQERTQAETEMERKIREATEKAARIAADKKRKLEEAKAEKERMKDDPVCQAQRLGLGLQKDLASLQVLKMDVSGSPASADQKKKYTDRIVKMVKDLDSKREKLARATTQNAQKLQEDTELKKQAMRDLKSDVKKMIQLAQR